MRLPVPPARYDASFEAQRNQFIEQADNQNLKRLADLEVVAPQRLILRSPDGTKWQINVDNSGNLTATTL
jgi:hypothetical protein